MPVVRETTLAMSLDVKASWRREVESYESSVPSGGMGLSREGMMEYRNCAALCKSPSPSAVSRTYRPTTKDHFSLTPTTSSSINEGDIYSKNSNAASNFYYACI